MDPYLEEPAYWAGVHTRLIASLDGALNRLLPEGYYADVDEHVWLRAEEPDDRRLIGRPENFVTHRNGSGSSLRQSGGVAVAEPTTEAMLPNQKSETQKYVKIVGPDRSTVVSVIEILSPSNKGSDRSRYLAKREEYFAARTNLVEIDLLRDGQRMPMGRPSAPGGDYYYLVSRGAKYPAIQVWRFTVREELPNFPLPLLERDGDLAIPLQSLFEKLYDANRYATRVDYSLPPVPPLRSLDAEWAESLLKKAARKRKK